MRQVYINGEFKKEDEAKVSVFDRGLLFSDSLYEVTTVINGKLIDFNNHMKRLDRSMTELKFKKLLNHLDILIFHRKLIELNNLKEGMIYLQVTRGVADRSFDMPKDKIEPTVLAFTQEKKIIDSESAKNGIKVMTLDDMRWKRCDIKTTQLLYASMAKTEATEKGFDDAWMLREGYVTEGSSSNAWIIKGKIIMTRQSDNLILSGITRNVIFKCAKDLGYEVMTKNITLQDAQSASEAFITSATACVMPVVKINTNQIGDGKPGKFVTALRAEYIKQAVASAI
ncbi:IlvE Branched-chain amino acid aminotransferase/4-amino-4-deoxychorismate lyase [Candidatus Pelagibacterales bacterium]|jgi:D-alanine transaminase